MQTQRQKLALFISKCADWIITVIDPDFFQRGCLRSARLRPGQDPGPLDPEFIHRMRRD